MPLEGGIKPLPEGSSISPDDIKDPAKFSKKIESMFTPEDMEKVHDGEGRDFIDYPRDDAAKASWPLPDNDFWPKTEGESLIDYDSNMDKFLKAIEPLVSFLETAAFVIPEGGVIASASIGLLWSVVQPDTIQRYQEPLVTIIGDLVSSKLKTEALSKANEDLKNFSSSLKSAINFAIPKNDSDIDHAKKLAGEFERYVGAEGLLVKAFDSVKTNLPWYTVSAHTLLITSMEYILQAYQARLMIWSALAMHARSQDDVRAYNQAQLEVIVVLQRLPKHIVELQQEVSTRIYNMKDVRKRAIEIKGDTAQTHFGSDIVSHRLHGGNDYYVARWIEDPEHKRHVFTAQLKKTTNEQIIMDVGSGIVGLLTFGATSATMMTRENGAGDNDVFDKIMTKAKDRYTEQLSTHMEFHFVRLIQGVQKVVDGAKVLEKRQFPRVPPHGPVFIPNTKLVKAPSEALKQLKLGEKLSYRYVVYGDSSHAGLSSPWSEFGDYLEEGALQPVYIGDGSAAMETEREIFRRTSSADDVGILVGKIQGHCILTWPETKVQGRI